MSCYLTKISDTNIADLPTILTPVLTFAIYAALQRHSGNTLTVSQAFTSLSILAILNTPLATLISALPSIASSLGSFNRIGSFLSLDERKDIRECDEVKQKSFDEGSTGALPDKISSISIHLDEIKLDLMDVDRTTGISHDVLVVESASFGPKDVNHPILHNVNLRAQAKQLIMILGPVGCGKSTLLKGILGECPCWNGSVRIASKEIAYCDQSPWLINTTIRQNILESGDFDSQWYKEVVYACALDVDFLQYAHGDETVVGSRGIALSGGQKHRVVRHFPLFSP